jgi:hypothetical protein
MNRRQSLRLAAKPAIWNSLALHFAWRICQNTRTKTLMTRNSQLATFFWAVILATPCSIAISDKAKTVDREETLFIVERSTNAQIVHYSARITKDGALDPKTPIVAYWEMKAEDGRREPLGRLERSMAWGFSSQRDPSGQFYRMTLVSQKQREIRVYQVDGSVRAEMQIAGHRAYLHRIYAQIRKTKLLWAVDYYQLFGIDILTNEECSEKVLP